MENIHHFRGKSNPRIIATAAEMPENPQKRHGAIPPNRLMLRPAREIIGPASGGAARGKSFPPNLPLTIFCLLQNRGIGAMLHHNTDGRCFSFNFRHDHLCRNAERVCGKNQKDLSKWSNLSNSLC